MQRSVYRFAHLFHQILNLPEVPVDAGSVQGCLALFIPLVPLKWENTCKIQEARVRISVVLESRNEMTK